MQHKLSKYASERDGGEVKEELEDVKVDGDDDGMHAFLLLQVEEASVRSCRD